MVVKDLNNHLDRQSQSVVVTSQGFDLPRMTPEQTRVHPLVQQCYLRPIQELHQMGVPIVFATGSGANVPGGSLISNSIPQLFQDVDTPLILVGAADYNGRRADLSLFGRLSTLYAPSVSVDC
jgi:hypothetical protein